MSSSKIRMTAISAAIVLLLAAAVGVLFFGRSGGDGNYEKRLEQAELYLESSDYDNAIAIYNGIIAENSECAEAYAGLSEAYYKTERFEKAMEILERGLDNTDGDPVVSEQLEKLFPDAQYAEAEDDSFSGPMDGSEFNLDDITTAVPETEEQSDTDTTSVPEATETEGSSETTAPTEETTTPTNTTTAAPTTTTAAPPAPVVTTVRTTAAPVTTTTVTTTTAAPRKITVRTLTSMSVDEVYSWCSKNGLTLTVIGSEEDSDRIVSQSPAPDTVVEENSEIIIVLAD